MFRQGDVAFEGFEGFEAAFVIERLTGFDPVAEIGVGNGVFLGEKQLIQNGEAARGAGTPVGIVEEVDERDGGWGDVHQ